MATHSSILAWRIPWTEEPGGLNRVTKSQTQLEPLSMHTYIVDLQCCVNFCCTSEWLSYTYKHIFNILSNYDLSQDVEYSSLCYTVASLKAQWVENSPAMQKTQVQSLGWEDPLEEEMATHYSILAWRIPWTEEPGGYSPWGGKELDTTGHTHTMCCMLRPWCLSIPRVIVCIY